MPDALIPASALLALAEAWAQAVGGTVLLRYLYTPVALAAMPDGERHLLSAACELVDLVGQAEGGQQCLIDFGLKPVGDGEAALSRGTLPKELLAASEQSFPRPPGTRR